MAVASVAYYLINSLRRSKQIWQGLGAPALP